METLYKKMKTFALVGALSALTLTANADDTQMGKKYLQTPAPTAVAQPTNASAPVKATKRTSKKAVKKAVSTLPVQLSTQTPNISASSSSSRGYDSNGWYLGGGVNTAGNGGEVVFGKNGKNLGLEAAVGVRNFSSNSETSYGGVPFSGKTSLKNKTQDITFRLDLTAPLYKAEKITTNYAVPNSSGSSNSPSNHNVPSGLPVKPSTQTAYGSKPVATEPVRRKLEVRIGAGPAVLFRTSESDVTEAIYLNGALFGSKTRKVLAESNKPHAGFSATLSAVYKNFLGLFVSQSAYDKVQPVTTVGAYVKFGGDNSSSTPATNYTTPTSSSTYTSPKGKK